MTGTFDQFLKYDANTGVLYWRERSGVPAWWNTKYAGKPAGSLSAGYLRVALNGENIMAHRIAWAMVHGSLPNFPIDHVNGNKRDNRISNLIPSSAAHNAKNQKRRVDCKVEKGIRIMPKGTFQVRIGSGGATHVGTFATMGEAIAARDAAYKRAGYSERHISNAG